MAATIDPAVQAFVDAIPEKKRPLFDRLQSLIFELYPEAETYISYQIPTYRVGKCRVYLGLWKDGVSLHAIDPAPFKAKHPKIKTGRGSLNFKVTDEVPEADVREVISQAVATRRGPNI